MKNIKSELSPYEPAYMNIRNGIQEANIFDDNWFYETDNDDKYHFYEEFIEQFAEWMGEQGDIAADLNEYRNKPFDVEYYFQQYMEDPEADHSGIAGCYNAVFDWAQGEEDFAVSEDYLDGMYRVDGGEAADIEFYASEYDIQDNAERIFRYVGNDKHGFKSADDMVQAVNKCVDDGLVQDVDQYDAGGMGYHAPVDGSEDYFETGSCFLGNGDIEWQMQTGIPYSEKNDYADELNDCRSVYRYFAVRGDCIYTTSDMLYVYGIPWADVERAGDELGVRNNTSANQPDDSEEIPF